MRALARRWWAAAALGLGPAVPASAATQDEGGPGRVEVGVWLNDVHTIDLVDGSLGAELYLWTVSPDEEFHPFEVFQVLNGRDWTVRSVSRRVLPDGEFHTSGYVSVTINHDWDLEYSPSTGRALGS